MADGPGRRARPRRRARAEGALWTDTTSTTRPGRTCCAGSGDATRRPAPTSGRWNWRATRPSGRSWPGDWPRCVRTADPVRPGTGLPRSAAASRDCAAAAPQQPNTPSTACRRPGGQRTCRARDRRSHDHGRTVMVEHERPAGMPVGHDHGIALQGPAAGRGPGVRGAVGAAPGDQAEVLRPVRLPRCRRPPTRRRARARTTPPAYATAARRERHGCRWRSRP